MTIANYINQFKIIFTTENDKIINYNLFLTELEEHKKELSEIITNLEGKVYIDPASRKTGPLAHDFLKSQLDTTHRKISATYANYLKLSEESN